MIPASSLNVVVVVAGVMEAQGIDRDNLNPSRAVFAPRLFPTHDEIRDDQGLVALHHRP